MIVQVDPRYFRPAEVETLLGDPTKAHEKLGWKPETTLQEMVSEMVAKDLEAAKNTPCSNLMATRLPSRWSPENDKTTYFVAGHRGMVGSAIVRQLEQRGDVEVVVRTRDELNLLDSRAVQDFFANERIDQVYLAAAKWAALSLTTLTRQISSTRT